MMPLVRLASTMVEWLAGWALWFLDLLYGGVPAEFESAFGLDESVKRLSAVTQGLPIFTRQQVAMGEVSRYCVSLQTPASFRNAFAPHFDGEFCEVDGRVRLVGQLTLMGYVKIFMTIWFGCMVLFLLVAIGHMLAGGFRAMGLALGAVGMIAGGAIGIWLGRQGWRDDITWLSRLIQDALSAKPSAAES